MAAAATFRAGCDSSQHRIGQLESQQEQHEAELARLAQQHGEATAEAERLREHLAAVEAELVEARQERPGVQELRRHRLGLG